MNDIENILNSTGNITIVGTKIGSFRIELEQVVHTHRTSHQSGRFAERPVWCIKSQSSLLKIYFHISGSQPMLALFILLGTPFHTATKSGSLQNPILYMMIHFSRSAAAQFRSLTEIAGKSPFFFMN